MSNKAHSISAEDYLKTIYRLSHEGGQSAATNKIAEDLAVTSPSVTGMLKKLEKKGLVVYSPYEGATLSKRGHSRAMKVLRRHRLVESFLFKCLKMSWDEIHEEAEVLEHALSDKLEQKIDEWLGKPRFDPHGAPIPDKAGKMPHRLLLPLHELQANQSAVVAEVRGNDPELLVYFERRGVLPGKKVKLLEEGEFGGSLKIRISGKVRYVGQQAAEKVMVEIIRET